MKVRFLLVLVVILGIGTAIFALFPRKVMAPAGLSANENTTSKTEAEWKQILTPEQYYILREKGTEAPFSSPLDFETRLGTYVTADCNQPVFRSEQKYDSGTGWPSFWAPITPDAVVTDTDNSLILERTEVLSKCGGHLGHVFNDGPAPTGLRYCMNGDALKFIPDDPNQAVLDKTAK